MSEAVLTRNFDETRLTVAATIGANEVWQVNGVAGVYVSRTSQSSGQSVDFVTRGKFTVAKSTSVAFLPGCKVYWDHSANEATYTPVNDRDFYIGIAVEDAAANAPTVLVDLNVLPIYGIDLACDAFLSTPVGTSAAGGFGYPVRVGGTHNLELTATNEAQKIDLLSVDGFSKDANAIVEAIFRVVSDGANATQDFNIGVANGTHATDADSITEAVFIHIDGNSTNLAAESDDGTTEVAATDTTVDYTEGSAVANRVVVWFDMRDPADVQIYINGANVLPATTFNVDAATGPLFLLAHLEKSAGTDTYKVAVDALRCWLMEQ